MSLNIIKGDTNLEKILPLYLNSATYFYGDEYRNMINYIINNLNIYLTDEEDKSALKVISELFGRDLTISEKNIFDNNNILNGGFFNADVDNSKFYIAMHDDHSFKTEAELVRKIYVDMLSLLKNGIININGSKYVRNGFSYHKTNEQVNFGIAFSNAVSKLFTNFIIKNTFYLTSDVYDSSISLLVAKYIFDVEYKCNNIDRFIDSFLICEPRIWDLYEENSKSNVNFFMMCNYLDQIEFRNDYSYIKSLKKELTEYNYNKKWKIY